MASKDLNKNQGFSAQTSCSMGPVYSRSSQRNLASLACCMLACVLVYLTCYPNGDTAFLLICFSPSKAEKESELAFRYPSPACSERNQARKLCLYFANVPSKLRNKLYVVQPLLLKAELIRQQHSPFLQQDKVSALFSALLSSLLCHLNWHIVSKLFCCLVTRFLSSAFQHHHPTEIWFP